MDPIAFSIGPLEIRWYGIMMATSMLLGAYISARLLRSYGRNGNLVWDALVWIIIGGIAGARLVYVLTNLGQFMDNPWEIFALWHGGLSFHGGIIVGALATYWFFKDKGIPYLEIVDSFVPGVSVGIILVRIGNFMNGDILGYKWNGPWKMNFPYDEFHIGAAKTELIYRHPTELYGMLVGVFCVLVAMILWNETYRTRRFASGTTLMGFIIAYSLVRSVIEDPFRAVPLAVKLVDPATHGYGLLTSSHLVSIPLILLGILGLTQLRRWEAARLQAESEPKYGGLTRQQRRAKERTGKKPEERGERKTD